MEGPTHGGVSLTLPWEPPAETGAPTGTPRAARGVGRHRAGPERGGPGEAPTKSERGGPGEAPPLKVESFPCVVPKFG